MTKYIKTPAQFDAMKFEGGRENATAVTSWLADNEILTSWYDHVPAMTLQAAEDAAEGTKPTVLDAIDERLVLEIHPNYKTVYPGSWIVLNEEYGIPNAQIFTEQAFNALFSEAPVA